MKFKKNDIVRFADNWCTEGEKKYRYVILEPGYDFFGKNRYKIGCLNSSLYFGSITVVDENMIVKAQKIKKYT